MSRLFCHFLCITALLMYPIAVGGEEPKPPRIDLYGDPLPPGALMRMGTIRLLHTMAEILFSIDGKQLISWDNGGELRFWDVATGKLVRRQQLTAKLKGDEKFGVRELSTAGNCLAVWGEALHLLDAKTGKDRGRISTRNKKYSYLLSIFSPKGDFLALQMSDVDGESETEIWDVNAIKKVQTLDMPPHVKLVSAAFTPDGKRLAGIAEMKDDSGRRNNALRYLFLWDTATGKLLCTRKDLHRIDVHDLAFSPDGKTLAVGGRGEAAMRFLAVDTLAEKTKLTAPADLGSARFLIRPTYSPDGRQLAAVYGIHEAGGEGFQYWIPHGVLLWELPEAKEPRRVQAGGGFRVWGSGGIQLAFAPDSKTLACRSGNAFRLFDAVSGRPLHQRPGHDQNGLGLAASPDGQLLASGDNDGVLRLWDAATSKQLWQSEDADLSISHCLFSDNGKRVAGSNRDGPFFDLQACEVETGKKLGKISVRREDGCFYAAALSADGKRFMGVYAKCINLPPGNLSFWDVLSGNRLSQRPYKPIIQEDDNGKNYGFPAEFSADGEQLSVWLGDRLGLAGVTTGCLMAKLPKEATLPLDFSPDGRLVTAMIQPSKEADPDREGEEVRALIETATGQEIVRLKWKAPNKIAFAFDNRSLIVSDHHHLSVWDAVTGEKRHQRAWPNNIKESKDEDGFNYVPTVAPLPGGRVAASMAEGDILVWDLQPSTGPNRAPERRMGREELESLWSDLAGDAGKAYRAIARLTNAPSESIAFLQEKLRPSVEDKRIAKLLADLDSDSFEAREKATRELTRLYAQAEPILRTALESQPSLEMRRRIEVILSEPRWAPPPSPRKLRAIAVLEYVGTPEAQRLVEKLAGGAASPETRAARAALPRLHRFSEANKRGNK